MFPNVITAYEIFLTAPVMARLAGQSFPKFKVSQLCVILLLPKTTNAVFN